MRLKLTGDIENEQVRLGSAPLRFGVLSCSFFLPEEVQTKDTYYHNKWVMTGRPTP